MENIQNMHTQIVQWLDELVPFIKHSLSQALKIEEKAHRKDLVTNIDKEVQEFLVGKITEAYPTHMIIGEESPPPPMNHTGSMYG